MRPRCWPPCQEVHLSDSAVDTVLCDVTDGVMRITLNRPDKANAIAPEARNRLIELLGEADGDVEVRAVAIHSTGKFFCTGADVSRMSGSMATPRPTGTTMRTMLGGAQRLIAAVLDCGKPVVAVVQGPAAGMGAHLAFASDFIVASEDAWFSLPFVQRGLALDAAGAYLLPRRMGLQKAKELAFLGDRLTAAEGQALGVVNRVCAADQLEATAAELVGRLAAAATTAIGLSKKLLNASLDADRNSAFLAEAMSQEIVGRTDDIKEGVAAFMDKRPVNFRGY
ncbi:MAG: enoyl-CoA hydratase [Sphingomonadales bacterium]|nr:enoyl-CoA hydratase [Sphingomonadales bacterium]MBU3990942.1 enoyl-CoA hydratase/isomerase family protein [Alphaproteobacteria bacterium]